MTKFDYWLWKDTVQFFNYNELYPSLEDSDNSFLRSQIGFRLPLADKFMAIAQLNLDWNGNPPPGKVKLDETVSGCRSWLGDAGKQYSQTPLEDVQVRRQFSDQGSLNNLWRPVFKIPTSNRYWAGSGLSFQSLPY